ncbi:pre-mRNA-splicing factor 18 isoform X2 [Paramuricea clavata]|uniref:Pre-mRNA-splicing factor 18 n=1 Tax=Paramuricea clavata TaxID=317549 RepID=A0A6S7KA29_PARCT|nr:pre-mRNA-splicing factor 18 isoform X2 [Paramuricea clavata]
MACLDSTNTCDETQYDGIHSIQYHSLFQPLSTRVDRALLMVDHALQLLLSLNTSVRDDPLLREYPLVVQLLVWESSVLGNNALSNQSLLFEIEQVVCKECGESSSLVLEDKKFEHEDIHRSMEASEENFLVNYIKFKFYYLFLKGTSSEDADQGKNIKVKNDGTTFEIIQEMAVKFAKGDKSFDQEVIYKFLKFLMDLWATDLNDRPQEVERSIEGKMAMATHRQTERYLKPLLRKLKAKATPSDILDFLIEIVGALLEREYVKANDSYLQMAIGNAPWPIGVTMVGIHARTGREKIFAQHVAHVLNDETQRKYIQALKRLMTFCQKKFEADPSKSVEYHAV